MPTCRECRRSEEFAHFKKGQHAWHQQNCFCREHNSVEPVFGYDADTRKFGPVEAPAYCFKQKTPREHSVPSNK